MLWYKVNWFSHKVEGKKVYHQTSMDKKEKWTLHSCSYVTNYIFSFNNYVALNTFLKLCLKSFSIFSDLLT